MSRTANAKATPAPTGTFVRWRRDFDRRTRIYTTLIFAWFELRKAHAGSFGGMLWILVTPLAQCLIYVFIFTIVLNVRFEVRPGVPGSAGTYAIYILAGLVPWIFISSVVNVGTDMIQQYAVFIRQPNFPYRIIPTVVILLALPAHLAGLAVLLASMAVVHVSSGGPAWLFLGGIYLCSFFALRGIATLLGLLTMYIRDLRHIVSLLLSFLVYFSPVFYTPTQLPAQLHILLYINPLAYALGCFKYGYTGDSANAVISPPVDLAICATFAFAGWAVQHFALTRFRSKGLDSVG